MVPASITIVVYCFIGRAIQIVATTLHAGYITLMCWKRYELVSIIGVVKILEDEATWQLHERQLFCLSISIFAVLHSIQFPVAISFLYT